MADEENKETPQEEVVEETKETPKEEVKSEEPKEAPVEEKPKADKESASQEPKKADIKVDAPSDKVFDIVETVKSSGKLSKGINEVTKAMEKGKAVFVVLAKDITPPEVVMHIPLLAKEKGIPFAEVSTKEELGAAAGLEIPTSCVAVISPGEAKETIEELTNTED